MDRDNQRSGWFYGWTIVCVMILVQMSASGLTHNALSMFLGSWSADFGVPVSTLMFAIVVQLLVGSPISPIAGALCDRYPLRRLLALGLGGVAIFFVAVSMATQAWHIIALYALVTPALVLCSSTPVNALIARWFVKRIGLAMGISAMGMGLGGVVLPGFIAAFMPQVGWRAIWFGAGLLIVVVVIPIVLLVVRERPHQVEPAPEAQRFAEEPPFRWGEVLARRNFWLAVFAYLIIMGTGSALHQNAAPYLASRGMSTEAAALMLSVLSISHLAATLFSGILIDRFGVRLPIMGLALAVAAGLALMIVAKGLPLMLVAAVLVGCNTGVFTPLAAAMTQEFGVRGFGRAFGLAMFFLPLSTPLAFVLARTAEISGSYDPALLGFIALLLVAAVLAALMKSHRTKEELPSGAALAPAVET